MKDRAHKAGTLALTSGPPLQTSFNLWEADKFCLSSSLKPPQTPYSSRLKTVRSRPPFNDAPTRQARWSMTASVLSRSAGLGHPGRRVELNETIVRESNCERAAGP
jgi:hypothetical protein